MSPFISTVCALLCLGTGMAFVPPVRNPIAHGNMVRYNAITASRSRVSQLHMAADKSEILGKVRSIVVQQLAVEESQVTPSASFTQDLGADSLDTVELIMALEEGFDIEIEDDVAANISTVDDVVEFIAKSQP